MMKRLLKLLTAAVAVIVLFTACEQFLKDPEDFLSYWASEAFIKDHNISSAHRPDGAGVPCVGSSEPVDITLTVHNPKNFPLVMPISSAPAGIVEFKELSPQPAVGTHYELEQTDSGRLKLTYKQAFLQKYEQGSAVLNPTITLKAKDGRVFKKTYTFGIKSNTPPPKPKDIVIAKTNTSPSKYVLCLKFDSDEMRRKIGNTDKPVHNDIANITIKKDSSSDGSSYNLSYNDDDSDFQNPEGILQTGSFIKRESVAKLTEDIPQAQEKWVLYFKTEVPVESSNEQTSYTITLSDKEGVVSDSLTAELRKRFKVTFDSQGGSIVSDQYIEKDGKVTEPPNPTKEGYTFGGWYTDTLCSTLWDFANNTVTSNITLYAKWMAGVVSYKVEHYQQNIDETYPSSATETESKTGTTGENAAYTPKAYEGFTHQSGLTEINGTVQQSGTINADGTTVVKLYYKRKQITVTFDPNGGNIGGNTGTVTRTDKYGAPLTVPSPQLQGKTLSGWSPALPSPPTFPAEDATYTAQWTTNTYKVRFNGNGNTGGSMSDQTFTYGQSQQLSANGFTKKGHTFDGWATSASGSKFYNNQQSVINLTDVHNGTVNLYAVWKIETYTVRFSVANGKGTLKGEYGGQNEIAQNGGGIKTLTNVPYDSTVSFEATADEGWEVEEWTVSSGSFATGGGSGAPNATATLTVDRDKTVRVKFKPGEFNLAGGGPDAWKRLREEAAKTEGSHTIVINGEITATGGDNAGEITLGRDLTIKGKNSAVLDANNHSRIFNVENGKTLTLENITLKNGNAGAGAGGGVYVDGGTLIMKDSSTITGCSARIGGGVCVAINGTFKMQGGAKVDENNEVYLGVGKFITVTGPLNHEPAAKIKPANYARDRVLAKGGSVRAENFTVAPDTDGKSWRYKKVGNDIKFVKGKLTVTFVYLKCIREDDGPGNHTEYFWDMTVDNKTILHLDRDHHHDLQNGQTVEFNASEPIDVLSFSLPRKVPIHIEIWDYDAGGQNQGNHTSNDDNLGTTDKDIVYDYDGDYWTYDGKRINLGHEETITEKYRTGDGDTDVQYKIRWSD